LGLFNRKSVETRARDLGQIACLAFQTSDLGPLTSLNFGVGSD